MEPRDVAGLKRKYAATQEPAKKSELGTLLRSLGHDPDEIKDTKTPDGRTADQKVTTAKAEAGQEKAAPKRPGRPAKEAVKDEAKEEKAPAKAEAKSTPAKDK